MANFDNNGSRSLAMASVKGTVKWFNGSKGYGFVTLDNGSDAFCHASALAQHGQTELPQGTTVVCDLQDSPRGLQVVAVHSIDTSTAEASAAVTASAVATASAAAIASAAATGSEVGTASAATATATPVQAARWSRGRSNSSMTQKASASSCLTAAVAMSTSMRAP